MRIIATIEDFRSYRWSGEGYFVITDTANPTRMHDVRCSYLSEERFFEKVVLNGSKNGQYVWVEHLEDGARFGAVPCSRCL